MANEVYGRLSETVRGVLGKQKPRTGYLGYIIGGTMTIQCEDDPSRVYVRFPDNSYGRYLHKGRIALTPVADVAGTPVACGKDEEGYDAILGVSSAQAPGIIFGRGGNIQIGGHTHGIEDIVEIGDGTPTAGRVLFGDGDSWEGTQLEAAIDSVVTGDATGYVKRTGTATYVVDNAAPGSMTLRYFQGAGAEVSPAASSSADVEWETTTPTVIYNSGSVWVDSGGERGKLLAPIGGLYQFMMTIAFDSATDYVFTIGVTEYNSSDVSQGDLLSIVIDTVTAGVVPPVGVHSFCAIGYLATDSYIRVTVNNLDAVDEPTLTIQSLSWLLLREGEPS